LSITGLICAGISVFFFGSNFVPVKKFETGDGIFFQLCLCIGIFTTGTVVHVANGLIRHYTVFPTFAMLGGMLWAIGNLTVVPVIKTIGLGMGISIWGITSIIIGWTTGAFGLFGTEKEYVHFLNYFGVAAACIAVFVFVFIKPDLHQNISNLDISYGYNTLVNDERLYENQTTSDWTEKLSVTQKRIVGVVFSIMSGVLYGSNFTPVNYLMNQDKSKERFNALNYVFAHFTGILLTSIFIFILYCIVLKNKPKIHEECALPAFFSGVLWATAQIAQFISNEELGMSISFPIIGPGALIVANLWSAIIFKEIRGKNIYLLLLASAFVAVSITLISMG